MHPLFHAFSRQVSRPAVFRWFLFRSLPAAFFAGLRLRKLDEQTAAVSVSYSWLTRNPFRSMYFAVQAMAAEMSTGLLASGYVYRSEPGISILVTGVQAEFIKRVTGEVIFTCRDGEKIAALIADAVSSGEARTLTCLSVGKDRDGAEVSRFNITWSFRARKNKQL
ncbi:MAG TPA: DUF4442 domain-containing protein [Sediminibacterium sp.]|nr:DUF4442 domain-containing protein [Sediminibacterium sp.]